MASPWRKPFDPKMPIRISCKNDTELRKRVKDMESRGYELVESYVEPQKNRRADTTYVKHIAKLRRVSK